MAVSTILVPLDISAPEEPDRALLDLLSPVHVVLLGYYPVPDQNAPAHLRDQYEEEAAEKLDAIADDFAEEGSEVTSVLVFTRDRDASIERVANERDCTAILTSGTTGPVDRVLVPLRGEANLTEIVTLLADLLRVSEASVTLFTVTTEEGTGEREFLLRGAADRLREAGVDPERVDWALEEADGKPPEEAILERADEYDLLVVGETEPTLRERILGAVTTRLIDRTDQPVLVVRSP